MAPDLECFDHVHIFVRDREASERWYAEVMGLTRIADLEFWAACSGPLTLSNPAGTIHLALFERPPQPCRTVVALSVDVPEFIAWQRHLSKALGSSVEAVDHEVAWSLYFADPDGNPYELISYEYAVLASQVNVPDGELH
jgi:catechol 2,3-dioxygenase-like lactoylglutathione lyase family enzyme